MSGYAARSAVRWGIAGAATLGFLVFCLYSGVITIPALYFNCDSSCGMVMAGAVAGFLIGGMAGAVRAVKRAT